MHTKASTTKYSCPLVINKTLDCRYVDIITIFVDIVEILSAFVAVVVVVNI